MALTFPCLRYGFAYLAKGEPFLSLLMPKGQNGLLGMRGSRAVNLAVVCANGAIYLRCALFATVQHCAWSPRSTAMVRIVVGLHMFSFGHAIVGRFSSIIDIRCTREWHQLVGARESRRPCFQGSNVRSETVVRCVRNLQNECAVAVSCRSVRERRTEHIYINFFCQNACV